MSLSARNKQRFFLQLAQLLRSGAGLPTAAERLVRTGSGEVRQVARQLQKRLADGATAEEAFDGLQPALDPMERVSLTASARTGRLDVTLQRLAEYFEFLERSRREMLRHCYYPLFVMHFGVLVFALPTLLGPEGLPGFLWQIGKALVWPYAIAAVLAVGLPIVFELAATSGALDRFLRLVPAMGRIRRDLSVGRFFGTLDMQLDAGVNVIDSLIASATASRSGLIRGAVERALPELRAGSAVGPLLAESGGALPKDALSALILAEETGELHRTLPQLQAEYDEDGLNRLKLVAEWLPRLLYLGVALYTGWKVVSFYQGYMQDISRQIDAI